MRSTTSAGFRQLLGELLADAQKQARAAYRLFRRSPQHPSLQFKRLWRTPPIYSARVGINYRAVGVMDGDLVVWYWIGTHADYDQLIKKLPH